MNSKMSFNDWIDVLNQAFQIGCRSIQFIGGEPTIHPDLIRLIEQSRILGFEFIEVYTNGINISENMLKVFVKYNVNLAFSVYSFNSFTHDLITQRANSLNKTLSNIKRSLGLGLNVRVGVICMSQNKLEIERTIMYLKELGIVDVKQDILRGIGRGGINSNVFDPYNELCGACWDGKLVVDYDGNIFPCVFSRFNIIGSVKEKLNVILEKVVLHQFREKIYNIELGKNRKIKSSLSFLHNDSAKCVPDRDCMPDRGCRPAYCTPENCRPICAPTCSPTCSPNCSPYCSPSDSNIHKNLV